MCNITFQKAAKSKTKSAKVFYTHFKSCDQSLDKTSCDFSNIFRAMQSCVMSATSSIPTYLHRIRLSAFQTTKIWRVRGVVLERKRVDPLLREEWWVHFEFGCL